MASESFDREQTSIIARTLICRDHEVMRFRFDIATRRVTGDVTIIDRRFLPIGTLDHNGRFSSSCLARWLRNRAVPTTRPGLSPVLQHLELDAPEELLFGGLGLSLSDQYWLKPDEDHLTWDHINFFEQPFSPALGEALAPHDPDSGSKALARIGEEGIVVASSPDAALNGNLSKRWEIRDEQRMLIKSGKPENLFQEPMNERIATLLCRCILPSDAYVPYELEQNGYPSYVSVCPCMVDACTEFVPAADVILSRRVDNNQSRFEAFVSACEEHGICNARLGLEQMLVVDHILANFDRHWGNFGILMDTESRTWIRIAPIFDTGEALWCDRPLANDFSPYRMRYPMPFIRAIGNQLERYAHDLSWLELEALSGFADEAVEVLALNRAVADIPGRLDGIHAAIERAIEEVRAVQQACMK